MGFLAMDKNHEGTITLGELKQVLESQFHLPDSEVKTIFETLDSNHDESVHYSDFLAAMRASRVAMHDDLIAEAFRRFDTDNTGKISMANLREVLGQSYEGQQLDEILAEVPHEGADIDYREFIEYLRHPEADERHHKIASAVIDSELMKSEQSGKMPEYKARRASISVKDGAPEALSVKPKAAAKAAAAAPSDASKDVQSSKSCSIQ